MTDTNDPLLQEIDQLVRNEPVLLFMKGTPQFPMCGFSGRAAQVMQLCGVPYRHVNVIERMDMQDGLKRYNGWPTFPALFIGGELIGGSDIMIELYEAGELQKMLAEASAD